MAEINIDLLINAAESANTLAGVRKTMKEIKAAMLTVGDEGSVEFNRLAQAAAQLEDKVGDVNERIAAFNPDGFAALNNFAGKAAGAVSAVTGAMALFGDESEETQKALMKVQAAMALTQGLEAVKGLKKAFNDLWKVMLANPIMVIVAGIAAIAVETYALIKAYQAQNSEVAKLTREYEKQKKVSAELSAEYDREIDLLTAQGASEEEIIAVKKKKIEVQLLEAEASARLHLAKIKDIQDNDSLYESYLNVASSIEGFLGFTEQQELTLAQIQKNKEERAKGDKDAFDESINQIKDLRNSLAVIDAEVETKRREAGQSATEDKKKQAEKEAADHAALMDQILIDEIALGDELIAEQERINAEIDAAEQERAARHQQYVNEKHRREQEAHDKQKKRFEEEKKLAEMVMKARLDAVANLFGSLSQLAGKNAKLQKAFAVAEATINTYKGVTAALSQPLPTPINLVNAAAVLAAGIANVRKILAVEPSAGGGGTSGGGDVGGGLGAFGNVSAIGNEPAQPVQPTTQLDQNGNPVGGQNQPIRVFVVESDITNTQNQVQVAQSAVAFR